MTFLRSAKNQTEEQESGPRGDLSNEDVPLTERVRVLLSRDDEAHRRGYNIIATLLRNEGYEVILGGTQTPREIAMAAASEDVDIICYHLMTGAPEVLVPLILENLRALDIGDRPLILGGIVPLPLIPKLKALGVAEVFLPASSLTTILSGIRKLVKQEEKVI